MTNSLAIAGTLLASLISGGADAPPNAPVHAAPMVEFVTETVCLAKALYGENRRELAITTQEGRHRSSELAQHHADVIVQEARKNSRTICDEAVAKGRYNGFTNFREPRNWPERTAWKRAVEEAFIKMTWRLGESLTDADHFLGPDDAPTWEKDMAVVANVQGWRFLRSDR